jgi:DHA2 family multidrug resistance protein
MTVRNADTVHARLVEGIRPDNPIVIQNLPNVDFSDSAGMLQLNAEITRQASMVSYVDAFYLLFLASLLVAPLILLMRPPKGGAAGPALHLE